MYIVVVLYVVLPLVSLLSSLLNSFFPNVTWSVGKHLEFYHFPVWFAILTSPLCNTQKLSTCAFGSLVVPRCSMNSLCCSSFLSPFVSLTSCSAITTQGTSSELVFCRLPVLFQLLLFQLYMFWLYYILIIFRKEVGKQINKQKN